jgi:hypothetical protein
MTSKRPKSTKTKSAKIGRPVEPVPSDLAEEIIAWITDGKTLREYCRQEGKPSWHAVYDWVRKDEEFARRFAHARDAGADAIAEDTIAMIDEAPDTTADGSRIDPAFVQWRRIQVEQRLKLLAKWSPKKYGDKVGVEHGGSVSLHVVTGVPTA